MFDDLRPYLDSEVEGAVRAMCADPMLLAVLRPVFRGRSDGEILELVASQRTVEQFQKSVAIPMLQWVIDNTTAGFSWSGVENIDRTRGHLYISNHRDIVLDGALLQYVFLAEGMPTSELTFGSNLISSPLVEHLARLNKLFKIIRTTSGRDFARMSQILSEHLHEVVAAGASIWIAQRNGRTKDGVDTTERALVKMIAMSNSDVVSSLQELNIEPFAISYELESCDVLKAREMYLKRRGDYVKAAGEDYNSIVTGIRQPKGRIHISVAQQIDNQQIEVLRDLPRNEIIEAVSQMIDERIRASYHLFPTNYAAADIIEGKRYYASHYTPEERAEFEQYVERQLSTLPPELERDELRTIFLEIYANPVFADHR